MSPDKRPDFSNVQSGFGTTEQAKPDFSNVQSGASSTEQITGGSGGSGGAGEMAERSYTVQSGDTLSHIAKAHYGKPSKWHAIFDANRDQLQDPDKIFPGQVLKIPAIDLDKDGDADWRS
jgi:nucleoid-associated protein YgaU